MANFLSRAWRAARGKAVPAVRTKKAANHAHAHAAVGAVVNAERDALVASDAELSMAMHALAGRSPANPREQDAARQHGLYGNLFSGDGAMAARFDSALTDTTNAVHWSMADALAADAAANPMIRYILRNRSRYEVANNSLARGLVDTIATDLIGSGPRLHVETGDDAADAWLEDEFARWSRAVKLAEKLRTMAKAKVQDGEAFSLQISNPGLATPVKLDLRPIEADQVRFVDIALLTVPSVDGIRFDDFGNPVSYHILRVHPGFWSYATGYIGFPWEYDVWPANFVLHWFRSDRPGQHRGIPEIAPALPLFAYRRRFALAVIQAAESAANQALFMHTPLVAEENGDKAAPDGTPGELFPLVRNMIATLPDGYDITQLHPEEPSTTYEMFDRCIVREIGRCLKAPYQKISGDSSSSNFSAANHDHLDWWRGIDETRKDLEYGPMDRLLAAWTFEARDIRTGGMGDFGAAYMPPNVRQVLARSLTGNACDLPVHTWDWPRREWPNPQQEASADEKNLQMGTDSLANICSRKGSDYRKVMAANAKALGMTVEKYREEVLVANFLTSPRAAEVVETADVAPGSLKAPAAAPAKQEATK
jgi:capsid protein